MPRAVWGLVRQRPVIQAVLAVPGGAPRATLTLLADTGAGSRDTPFALVLRQSDCRQFRIMRSGDVVLAGAFSGTFQTYAVWVEIPDVGFADFVIAAGVPDAQLPSALDGIATFRFLNSFTYGNFGVANQFGLESR